MVGGQQSGLEVHMVGVYGGVLGWVGIDMLVLCCLR